MSKNRDLLPCRCGSENIAGPNGLWPQNSYDEKFHWQVECKSCGFRLAVNTGALDMISVWNQISKKGST